MNIQLEEVTLFYSYGTLGLSLDVKVKDGVQLQVMGNPGNSGLSNLGVVTFSKQEIQK